MSDLYKHNVDKFSEAKDCDEYLRRREHQTRGDVVIELLNEVMDDKNERSSKLLSIACSTGLIEEKMKKKLRITVYGIDAAKPSLKEASKRGIITKYADVAKHLPFKDSYFDFVFAGEIIEHLLDTRFFLSEINRVLKPEGYLILTTPNLARPDERLKLLFGKSPRQVSPLHPYLYLHIRPFTFDSLKKSLESCGFKKISFNTDVFTVEFFGKKVTIYSRFFARILPSFGSSLIVRARK